MKNKQPTHSFLTSHKVNPWTRYKDSLRVKLSKYCGRTYLSCNSYNTAVLRGKKTIKKRFLWALITLMKNLTLSIKCWIFGKTNVLFSPSWEKTPTPKSNTKTSSAKQANVRIAADSRENNRFPLVLFWLQKSVAKTNSRYSAFCGNEGWNT